MIDVKEAVRIAKEYILSLYARSEVPGLLLEEVEMDSTEKNWLVTFGFRRGVVNERSIGGLAFRTKDTMVEDRAYKTVKVNAKTGTPIQMNIRKV